MLTRSYDPYSGHGAPRQRDLEAEAADALAEIMGDNPQPDEPCVTCGKPEKPTHDANEPGPTVRHPFSLVRQRPPRKPPAKKPITRKRAPRQRKTPPPPKATP